MSRSKMIESNLFYFRNYFSSSRILTADEYE